MGAATHKSGKQITANTNYALAA